ncbi:MAG: hypothetical protein ABIJ86_06695 [Spirochaetota bacterium]
MARRNRAGTASWDAVIKIEREMAAKRGRKMTDTRDWTIVAAMDVDYDDPRVLPEAEECITTGVWLIPPDGETDYAIWYSDRQAAEAR